MDAETLSLTREDRVPGMQLVRIRLYAVINALVVTSLFGTLVAYALPGVLRAAAAALAAVVAVAASARALRLDFLADETGVVVRNYWRTFTFRWSDVELVRNGYLRVGVVPQVAIAFFVSRFVVRRGVVLVQATPVGEKARSLAYVSLTQLAPAGVPIGPTARPAQRSPV